LEYSSAVFIGRFQPFHNAHLEVVQQALRIAEKLIIVIGSCNAAPSIKNPFTYYERVQLITEAISPDQRDRVVGVCCFVFFYFFFIFFWVR
jgi:bifunctional NMN adenylyltransferase/nudix hydrolase